MGKKKRGNFRGGYSKAYFFLNRIFNIATSSALILISLPAFAFVTLIILLFDGPPVLYRGSRLGMNKKPFRILKFRTLIPDADKVTGPQALSSRESVVTPIGKFLRNTRLDELPQLFNILKGDMDIFGPRPHRREVYESIGRNVKRYERRFSVKPGLIGYPALFLTYNAPRQMQSSLDNLFLWKKQRISFEVFIIFYTIAMVSRRVVIKASRFLWTDVINSRILGRYDQKRALERLQYENSHVRIIPEGGGGGQAVIGDLVDINEKAFLATIDGEISNGDFTLELSVERGNVRGRRRRKVARCRGKVYRRSQRGAGGREQSYVIEYEPASPFNAYIIHQYFLEGSIVG